MNNFFRELRADEIECRISRVTKNGCSLLLYKDARCDMNILDEKVGPLGWKREHGRDNKNCIVSIWDAEKNQWIAKEDTGTESSAEAEKGLASDSFKRACVNWGIGRELYTAPEIWISNRFCTVENKTEGSARNVKERWVCVDKFRVTELTVGSIGHAKFISHIKIVKIPRYESGKETVVFDWNLKDGIKPVANAGNETSPAPTKAETQPKEPPHEFEEDPEKVFIDEAHFLSLKKVLNQNNIYVADICIQFGYPPNKPSMINMKQYKELMDKYGGNDE